MGWEAEIETEHGDRVDPEERENGQTFPDVELALIGVQQPFVLEELQRRFKLHPVYSEPDPFAALAHVGSRVRGAVGHGMAGLTRRHLELMPNLEICASTASVSRRPTSRPPAKGASCSTTAPVLFDDVADLAIALALACCRQIPQADRFRARGPVGTGERFRLGRKFTGMRAGIVGLGRIGIEVARRLEGFKTTIGYADPAPRDVPYRHYPDALELAGNSDVLFLCAAGGPKGSPPIIGREVLEALGPRGIFVNISRGWIVDEEALSRRWRGSASAPPASTFSSTSPSPASAARTRQCRADAAHREQYRGNDAGHGRLRRRQSRELVFRPRRADAREVTDGGRRRRISRGRIMNCVFRHGQDCPGHPRGSSFRPI